MPKVIENPRDRLVAEAREQVCTDDFTAEFIAESLLTWTIAGRPFEEICSILEKLF